MKFSRQSFLATAAILSVAVTLVKCGPVGEGNEMEKAFETSQLFEVQLAELNRRIEDVEQIFNQERFLEYLRHNIERSNLEDNDQSQERKVQPYGMERRTESFTKKKSAAALSLQELAQVWERAHARANDKWNPKRSGLSFARL